MLNNIFHSVMDAVYPPLCGVCGNFFAVPEENPGNPTFAGLMAKHVCPECAAAFTPVSGPMCTACGIMFKSRNTHDHLCGECRRVPKFFRSARAAGVYETSLMTALQQLKYRGRTELAQPLGGLLWSSFHRWHAPEAVDMIMPVPLHARKQRQRGFNQAWLLIRNGRGEAADGHTLRPLKKAAKNLLVRTRMTRSQTKLSRRERLDNVRGAFALKDKAAVNGRSVLLVDDVFTTGATVNECARVLTAAGATRVDVLTVARVR